MAVSTAPEVRSAGAPRLAPGIELIGEYQDSGFKEAPWLVRRSDGQTVQLSRLLYAVAERADGGSDYETMASDVSREVGRGVSAENVRELMGKLETLGVVEVPGHPVPELKRNDPMTALKFRAALVPEGVVD